MKLSALLKDWVDVPPSRDVEISQITLDSRIVTAGSLFLAVPGASHDGRKFIHGALARGAMAVVYEQDGREPAIDDPLAFGMPALRQHLGLIADRFHGSPSKHLQVVGVTGTNGKTTTTHLLAQTFTALNKRCGLIGTLGTGFTGALDPSLHTTPDALSVHRLLRKLADAGAQAVSMEVSSHALDQSRVAGVTFDIAVFTNLTRDHLDYHGNMDTYAAAKAKLFDFPHLTAAVINADDRFGRELIARARCPVMSFGFENGDVCAERVQPSTTGITLAVKTPQGPIEVKSALLGRFNAANLLAVLAVLLVAGIPVQVAATALAQAQPVAGRMERFGNASQPLVVVDYAHTPDALEKALAALREHTRGRLVCVFGCGGDRDRGKRPQMGAIAARLADWVIVTNDNPRHEEPMKIIRDIVAGMPAEPTIVPERTQAIRVALADCKAGDIVLVAGKGHEDYQQIGSERHPYSDRATVQQLLKEAA